MIILCVFWRFFGRNERISVLTWPLFQFLVCPKSVKPQIATFLFYKKVVPLNFGFYSLRNEQNFLSNQKTVWKNIKYN